jgi:hypothetical protein
MNCGMGCGSYCNRPETIELVFSSDGKLGKNDENDYQTDDFFDGFTHFVEPFMGRIKPTRCKV